MQMSHIETGDPVLGDIDGDAHGSNIREGRGVCEILTVG
jgi:hypothetical protein